MSLSARPYIGTWKLNNQQLVQVTPDALVYLNGDLSLPGCQKCSGKIDIQQFLTEVSVDAGTEAGSHSATFSLSIPLHHTESFARDAQFILRPGLEVHIYMRGYFPVKGLYSTLAGKKAKNDLGASGAAPPTKEEVVASAAAGKVTLGGDAAVNQAAVAALAGNGSKALGKLMGGYTPEQRAAGQKIYDAFITAGYPTATALALVHQAWTESRLDPNAINYGGDKFRAKHGKEGVAFGFFQINNQGRAIGQPNPKFREGRRAGSAETAKKDPTHFYNANDPDTNIERELLAVKESGYNKTLSKTDRSPGQAFQTIYFSSIGHGGLGQGDREDAAALADYGRRIAAGKQALGEYWGDTTVQSSSAEAPGPSSGFHTFSGIDPAAGESDLKIDGKVVTSAEWEQAQATARKNGDPVQGDFGPSMLEEMGLDGMGVENTLAYPYYHVFHGVVTQVNHSYTGGVSTVSVTCNSMLHFWQYHNMSTNASVFGARPTNSKNKMSLVGNNFTGMHPYAIIYSLHYDMAGAAGGVGYALSSKSNQTAVSEGGESLWSLNVKYWEKRFKRGTKLRMHGATGELFTTMAATWLSRKSSSTLTGAMRQRYSTKKEFARQDIGAEMLAVGLWGGKNRRNAIEATRFAAKSKPNSESAKFEINVLEMQAFVSDIGNWGQVNLFESTYESKLDVAQKVCGITGFEFYQDVDGDLVFKPPMWNLDTSTSRVYRIEDIDIININFSEKEPQVTYMTVKGGHFKGVQISSLENEWGVRGQYIDYRLVAQFGWRPGSYETNYFNDPKSMFFAAVNRMDVMNIANNSASVTIPVRPELRPGYPVYIPYLDCFYYCNSFAHSHSVGGQCTTSLQLVGKRAKFFAPGHVNQTGPSSIDLRDTRLPEKPLQVVGEDGRPRLSGFPNVVMALDPTAVNPLFFVVGMDIEDISDARVLQYMITVGMDLGAVGWEGDKSNPDSYYWTRVISTPQGSGVEATKTEVRFFFDPEAAPPAKNADKSAPINIYTAAQNYMALQATYAKQDEASLQRVDGAQAKVNAIQTQIAAQRREPDGAAKEKALAELDAKLDTAETTLEDIKAELQNQKNAREKADEDFDQKPESALLLGVYKEVSGRYRASAGYQTDGNGDLSSTINLLDMLSDKKATFSNGQQPGQYRYYSCSHPDPVQQGPRNIRYVGKKLVDEDPLFLENPPEVLMYSGDTKSPFPGAAPPEAALVPGKPQVGLRVLSGNPNAAGDVWATSQITELMFTVQEITSSKKVTSTKKTARVSGIGASVVKQIAQYLSPAGIPSNDQAAGYAFYDGGLTLKAKGQAGIDAMRAAAQALTPPKTLSISDGYFALPLNLTVKNGTFDASVPFGDYKWAGNTGNNSISLGVGMDKLAAFEWLGCVGEAQADYFNSMIKQALASVNTDLKGVKQADRQKVFDAWNTGFAIGAVKASTTFERQTRQVMSSNTTFSPVFPVSDDRGYRVIGSYRYGRGVDIDPAGVFDQFHKKDLFSLLDKTTIDQILKVFVERGKITIPKYEEQEVSGKKVTVPVGGTVEVGAEEAARYLNTEVLRQLRAANLTDAQILDYSAAMNKSGTANMLDFSLANLFTDSNLDGVQKIPVINAAYSLADLGSQQAGHVCDCKAAEASMLIEAFGQKQFLDGVPDSAPSAQGLGTGAGDAVTRWVSGQAGLAAAQWELQQQALRGQVLDRDGSHVVKSFLDATGIGSGKSPFEEAIDAGNVRLDALQAEARKVPTQAGNITTDMKQDQ